jgi:hypothetical protein
MTLAIAVEDPSRRLGVVALRLVLAPFGHLRGEDVQVTVAVNVAQLQRMAMDHRAVQQIMANPSLGVLGITHALVPAQGAHAVTRRDDNLGDL